jgi:hypothetical protein
VVAVRVLTAMPEGESTHRNTVSRKEQERRFREATAHETSHGGSLNSVRTRLAVHKL